MSFSRNPLVFVVLLILCVHGVADLRAQCNQRITITKASADEERNLAQIELRVEAGNSFKGQLISIDGTDESTVEAFSGTGTQSFTFAQLSWSKERFYRIVIEFEGEEKFLCKRKVKDVAIIDTK